MHARALFLIPLLLTTLSSPALAEDAAEAKTWSDTAEFSLVIADGNSTSESLGLRNLLTGTWEKSRFQFDLQAIRAATTSVNTVAVGQSGEVFEVAEEEDKEVSTELYSAGLEYARDISERSYWIASAGWLQNRPADIQSRSTLGVGLGTQWVDSDTAKFKTEYALTYTREEFTSAGAGTDTYAGARFQLHWLQKLNESTTYENSLRLDENLDDTDDLRADWLNAISVSINDRLALKVGVRLLYDNQPALEELPLEFPRGTPTGLTVLSPVDDLDTLVTSSLVVNF